MSGASNCFPRRVANMTLIYMNNTFYIFAIVTWSCQTLYLIIEFAKFKLYSGVVVYFKKTWNIQPIAEVAFSTYLLKP